MVAGGGVVLQAAPAGRDVASGGMGLDHAGDQVWQTLVGSCCWRSEAGGQLPPTRPFQDSTRRRSLALLHSPVDRASAPAACTEARTSIANQLRQYCCTAASPQDHAAAATHLDPVPPQVQLCECEVHREHGPKGRPGAVAELIACCIQRQQAGVVLQGCRQRHAACRHRQGAGGEQEAAHAVTLSVPVPRDSQ